MKLGPLQKELVKSLRNHPERQGKHFLGRRLPNGRYEACCLGEAGLIAKVCSFNKYRRLSVKSNKNQYYLCDDYKEIGFYDSRGAIKNTSYLNNEPETLSDINDSQDNEWGDWVDISYYMEACPEMFFSKSV